MKVTKHITDLIDTLQERCPDAFPKKPLPKVPIAFHQHKAIQRILNVNYRTADYILMLWYQGKRYDAAMVEGAPRIRCDGVAKGTVSRREAEFHKARLDEYYESRTAPKGYKVGTAFNSDPKTVSMLQGFIDRLNGHIQGLTWKFKV